MQYDESVWDETVLKVSKHFKVTADFDFMLFVVGLQERGSGMRNYSRDEKWDLINLGKCTLLANQGYLKKQGEDDEGWPCFEEHKNLQGLTPSFQKRLLKQGMVDYFSSVLN